MVTINQTALADFLSAKDDTPIVMLNLLRFDPDGGRQRHFEYLEMAAPILARFGAKILFRGDGLPVLTDGEVKMWDAVLLVQYPSRAAFMAMVEDPDYQVAFQVGKSALADIVLQPLKQTEIPG
jgi:uncharacterized protein (DUF1330 family)